MSRSRFRVLKMLKIMATHHQLKSLIEPFPKPLWLDKTFENTQKCSKTEGSQLIDIRVHKMQNDLPQRQISNIRSKFLRTLVHKKSSDLM